jgi:hypothetical protein
MIDVYPINFFNFGEPDSPAESILLYLNCEFVAFFGIEDLLGIIKSAQLIVLGKDYGTRNHRTGKRGHSRLVDSGDQVITLQPKLDLKTKQAVESLTFGAIASLPLANAPGKLFGTLAGISFESLEKPSGHGTPSFKEYVSQFKYGLS